MEGQDSIVLREFDSTYIYKFERSNDARLFYGTQGASLEFGSRNETDLAIPTALYNNVNDFIGVGITYKILDADLSFSPGVWMSWSHSISVARIGCAKAPAWTVHAPGVHFRKYRSTYAPRET